MAFILTNLTVLALTAILLVSGYKEKIKSTLQACKNGAEVTDEEMEEFMKPLIPKTEEEKCLMACVFKTFNVISDGVYDPKIALAVTKELFEGAPDLQQRIKSVIDHCGHEIKKHDNDCELASDVMKCHEKYEKEVGLL